MAKEVELKIRVADPESLRSSLARVAQPEGTYRKKDTYFRGPGGSFRVRESGETLTACRKEKTVTQGIEVSRELEFILDSFPVFEAFWKGLGFTVWYTKEKVGRAWRWGSILVEEGEVTGLGRFAELEILLDDGADEAAVQQAKNELLGALDTLGVPRSAIEPRTYAELLGVRG